MVLEFDRELNEITFRIEKEFVRGNLTIDCQIPTTMSGPFEWQDAELRITRNKFGPFILRAPLSLL